MGQTIPDKKLIIHAPWNSYSITIKYQGKCFAKTETTQKFLCDQSKWVCDEQEDYDIGEGNGVI